MEGFLAEHAFGVGLLTGVRLIRMMTQVSPSCLQICGKAISSLEACHPAKLHIIGVSGNDRIARTGMGRTMEEQFEWHQFDFESGSWQCGPLSCVPRTQTVACVAVGQLYIFGGLNADNTQNFPQVFNEEQMSWKSLPPIPTARSSITAVVAAGEIYIIGGRLAFDNFDDQHPCSIVEKYSVRQGLWTKVRPMPTARVACVAAVLDKRIYVIGGRGLSEQPLSTCEGLCPRTGCWDCAPTLRLARTGSSATVCKGSLFVFGGLTGQDFHTDTVEMLMTHSSQWQCVSNMPVACVSSMAAAYGDSIYILGGVGGGGAVLERMDCFKPATKKWSRMDSMVAPARKVGCIVANLLGAAPPDPKYPTAPVIEDVVHAQRPPTITEEEAAQIVAEQHAQWTAQNVGRAPAPFRELPHLPHDACEPIILLQFRHAPASFDAALLENPALEPVRAGLARAGYSWRLPTGAKVFLSPAQYGAFIASHDTHTLRPCHVVVAQALEPFVQEAARQLPSRRNVRVREAQTVAYMVGNEELIGVTRTFLQVPPVTFRSSDSVVQSTAEAHGVGNPRRMMLRSFPS